VGQRIAVLLVCLTVWTAAPPATASDFWEEVRSPGLRAFRQHVAHGREARKEQRWSEVLAAGERAEAAQPTRCEGPLLQGWAHAGMGDVEAAVGLLRAAFDLDATCFDAPDEGGPVAEMAAFVGDRTLAVAVLERVLGRMDDGAPRQALYALHGDMLLTLGPDRLADARRAYRQVLRRQADTRAALGLALALRRAGSPAEADEVARLAAAHGRVDGLVARLPLPESEKAARRAVALEVLGDMEGARQAWQSAAEGSPWREHAEQELRRHGARDRGRP
jgi:tetratricopeptide (TPR) repeat protein